MRKRERIVLLGLVASVAMLPFGAAPVRGGGLTIGLAVAVTADGSRLVAGGSNRVLYELDPTTLEVRRRVWLGRQIMRMVFSPDGTVLVVESTAAVQWLRADSLEPFATVEDARDIRSIPACEAVAMVVPDYRNAAIRLYAFADAQEQAHVPYDPRQNVAAYGVSQDGKRLALLYTRKKNEGEKKITGRDVPQKLREERGAALAEFQQRHDGYGAMFHVFDVESGKRTLERPLWYSCQDHTNLISWHGANAYVVGYRNHCAKIDAQGEVSVFALGQGFNDAFLASVDGKTLWSGGHLNGSRTRVPELTSTTFQIDELPGFSESYKAFTAAADGMAFVGTTAFRVARIGADGKVRKIAPVY